MLQCPPPPNPTPRRDTDRFVWDFPEFLPVFACGNYGDDGHFSLSAPGVAKNVLSVGASKSSQASFFDLGQNVGLKITAPPGLVKLVDVATAEFGRPFHEADVLRDVPVVSARPALACGRLDNADEVRGKVVLVERGMCYFVEKV